MNADLQKIRKSRFFKKLPDRAFERLVSLIKVRAYEAGEEVFNSETPSEFQNSYGYVVTGVVLFVNENSAPLGLALRDEFFLTRSFTLNGQLIHRLIAIDPRTFVVYVPRDVILLLAQATSIAELLEEIYASIFERSVAIREDVNGGHEVQSWLKFDRYDKILASWVDVIEQKRQAVLKQTEKIKVKDRKVKWIHGGAFTLCSFFILWARLHVHSSKNLEFIIIQLSFFIMILVILAEVVDLVLDSGSKKIMASEIKIESLEEELSRIHSSVPSPKTEWKEKLISFLKSNLFRKSLLFAVYGMVAVQIILLVVKQF